MKRRVLKGLILIFFLLILVFLLSMSFGAKRYTFSEILNFLFKRGLKDPLLMKIRFPRVISTFFVGASLSVAGLLSQSLFLNPLADPFLFGISSGANFFVTISLFLGFDQIFKYSLSLFALLGAFFTTSIIYLISKIKGKITPLNLLLAGIALNYFFSSISSFLSIWGRDVLNRSVFWSLTGFSTVNTEKIKFFIIIFIPTILFTLFLNIKFDAYILGEEEAHSLGINVKFIRSITLILISILTGLSVYIAGIVGFVGLMVPNILRGFFGSKHLILIIFSILFGGFFLMSSDLLSRMLLFPTEIPTSIITSFLGAPFFLYLLFKKRVV